MAGLSKNLSEGKSHGHRYHLGMRERYSFLESKVAEKAGGVPLLTKSLQLGIQLKLNGNGGQGIPLLAPVSEKAAME